MREERAGIAEVVLYGPVCVRVRRMLQFSHQASVLHAQTLHRTTCLSDDSRPIRSAVNLNLITQQQTLTPHTQISSSMQFAWILESKHGSCFNKPEVYTIKSTTPVASIIKWINLDLKYDVGRKYKQLFIKPYFDVEMILSPNRV